MGVRAGERVLEVGPGNGASLARMAERLGDGRIVGVERSATALARAGQRCADEIAAGRIRLVAGEIGKIAPAASGSATATAPPPTPRPPRNPAPPASPTAAPPRASPANPPPRGTSSPSTSPPPTEPRSPRSGGAHFSVDAAIRAW
ncbi:class I SAM-dependent methyltransferase [Nocardia sp. NPDC050378]|uniref:SAM-dependent methyltransferase n=1 Tax=Nocardia sp. NPDC050378 TaxID=3155400 RepID=UPI0034014DCE